MILVLKELLSLLMKKETSKDDEIVYLIQEKERKSKIEKGEYLEKLKKKYQDEITTNKVDTNIFEKLRQNTLASNERVLKQIEKLDNVSKNNTDNVPTVRKQKSKRRNK